MNRSRAPLPCLTGLRFLAALNVALCHFGQMKLLPLTNRVLVASGFLDGRPAVVLFFILSGFILTYNYDGVLTRQGLASYFVNRFARIYPIYVLCLIVSMALVVYMTIIGHTSDYLVWFSLDKVHHVTTALALSMGALLLLLTAWTPILLLDQPWNGLSWSLSCEAFFYLVFPYLLRRLRRLKTSRMLIAVLVFYLAEGGFYLGSVHNWLEDSGAGGKVSV